MYKSYISHWRRKGFFYLNVVGGEVEVVEAEEDEGAGDENTDCKETCYTILI